MGYLLEVNSIQKFRSDYFLHKRPHRISSSSAKETPFNQKKMNVWGGGLKMFGWGLLCFLLQNVIQENIEIIYFDWCMITITKNFVVYIFSSCMQASVYFGECEFSVKLFLMNWNKSVLILKLILSVSHNLDFFNWSKQCNLVYAI